MPDTPARQARKMRLKTKRERMFAYIARYKQRKGCCRCQVKTSSLEFDHIIPRYLGGRPRKPVTASPMRWWRVVMYFHHPNIQVMCHACHKNKTRSEDTEKGI